MQRAIITAPELAEVLEARDFLFRVRNSLHFLSKRHFDQLTFEYQERIAPMLGFKPRRLALGERDPDARLLSARQHHPAILRRTDRARGRRGGHRPLSAPLARPARFVPA